MQKRKIEKSYEIKLESIGSQTRGKIIEYKRGLVDCGSKKCEAIHVFTIHTSVEVVREC